MNTTVAVSTTSVGMMGDVFSAELVGQIPALRRRALRLTGQESDADDLVQQTVTRALERRAQFRPGSSLRAWLFTIERSLCIDAYRRRSVAWLWSLEEELYGPGAAQPTASAEETMPGTWVDEDLCAALPEQYRRAVLLSDVEQRPYAEVGAALDCPPGAVMSRLHRGRALLRRLLERRWAQRSPRHDGAYAHERTFKAEQRTTVTLDGRCGGMRDHTGMRQPNVLIVDNDQSLIRLMRRLLEDQVHLVISTRDRDAVGIARTMQPNLILLEVQRPGIDGIALSRRLRHDAATSHIPIVCISAELARGIRSGMVADAWLAKPLGIKQLHEVVDRWVPQARGMAVR
jgi:RNA polymerase sigma-70 factor (ECF subfamily)